VGLQIAAQPIRWLLIFSGDYDGKLFFENLLEFLFSYMSQTRIVYDLNFCSTLVQALLNIPAD